MDYKKIKAHKMSEEALRSLWADEYCNPEKPIYTFDNVRVSFFRDMFDHVFRESADRKHRDKSILSLNRLEKMLWIKSVLQDPDSILKQGWDRDTKSYLDDRRVAMVKNNYVVIIRFTGILKAKLVTAYELQEDSNISKILESPDWIRKKEFFEETKKER